MLIICRYFINLLLFMSLYRKRFRLLKARPKIESLNSGGNLIKRRLSLVYLSVSVCFFRPASTRLHLLSTKGSESIEGVDALGCFAKAFMSSDKI